MTLTHPDLSTLKAERLVDGPIISPDLDPTIGTNIQGPSLIRVPDWVPNPLGKYYLYFADHKGAYIRLAFADDLKGPWHIHQPGVLQLSESHLLTKAPEIPEKALNGVPQPSRPKGEGVPSFLDSATVPHIASPDVHVRHDRKEIVMYYHGLNGFHIQKSRAALSTDGINFQALPEILGPSYFRVFQYETHWYALSMPGNLHRSADSLTEFEQGPTIFNRNMRHCAVYVGDNFLYVFWSQVGDNPERILLSTVSLSEDWHEWRESAPITVLRPENPWEGTDQPFEPSIRDAVNIRVNQLRDPAIYVENEEIYLLYSVAGESGIAIARLFI